MINFDGRCDEALAFYQKALGAEILMCMRFKDHPEPDNECSGKMDPEKVMHAQFKIGSTVVMAADCHSTGKPVFQGMSLSLTVPTAAEADQAFAALSVGGQVQMPLEKTFFTEKFGMLTDKFGISWMVMVTPNPQACQA